MFSERVSVHGPMTQSQFLGSLGINFRVESLLQNCTEEQAESLRTGYWSLVGEGEAPFWEGPDEQAPIGMGTRYLAMAIVNKNQGVPVPFEWSLNYSTFSALRLDTFKQYTSISNVCSHQINLPSLYFFWNCSQIFPVASERRYDAVHVFFFF